MKIRVSVIVLVWIIFCTNTLFPQSVRWVKQISAEGYCLKTDQNDNFYISGSFENTAVFDTVTITSRGRQDIYLSKYSPNGDLIWVKTAGGEWYDEGFSHALNPTGENVYVTGFMHDATFEDTTILGYPFFIANYDSSGSLKWAHSLCTGGGGGASSIAVDSRGQMYLTGSAYGLILPDSLGFSNSQFFIIKFDESGYLLWIKGTDRTTNGLAVQPAQAGITCDINNNVYVAGSIQSEEIKFDSTHILIPEGVSNVFVVKYDSDGNVILAIQSKGSGQANPISIAVDTASNIYLTGCFEGSVKFDDITLESTGSFDIFTVKYDENGEVLWVRQAGSVNYDSGRNIKVDIDGNVYVIGINSMSAEFSDNILGKSGAFLAKYDIDGNLLYLKSIFHIDDESIATGKIYKVNDFALIGEKSILVTGFYNDTVYFDSLEVAASLDGGNIFIAKITENTTFVERSETSPVSLALNQNYPNPFNSITSISFELPAMHYTTLKIYDLVGREIETLISGTLPVGRYKYQWSATNFSSGIYFYRLQSGNYNEMKKLLLLK